MCWVPFMPALEITCWTEEAQRGEALVQAAQPGGARGTERGAARALPGSLVVSDIGQRTRKRAGRLMRSLPLLRHLKHDWIFTRPSGLGAGFRVRSQL